MQCFTHVNDFLLLVYLEKSEHASYELMMSAGGSNIIRMYEARGGEEHQGCVSGERARVSDEAMFHRITGGRTVGTRREPVLHNGERPLSPQRRNGSGS
jgi:hypothetical protein